MKNHARIAVFSALCLSALALNCAKPAPDTRAADAAAIASLNQEWFKAYTAGDAAAVAALYADDAVVNSPGVPPARGRSAILELYTKDIAGAITAGITMHHGSSIDSGISGDLGWEWGTFTAQDKSGTTVDAGKYVTVFARKDGKWHIIRDIWNSDGPMVAAK